jgi:hypothetical protein
VIAAERHELAGLERLHADRDPADPGGPPRGEVVVGAVAGVGLDRDLDRCLGSPGAEPRPDPRDRSGDAIGSPQRRRAPAEIDRGQVAAIGVRARVELADDRVEIVVVRGRPDLDREIAVRATLAAPRVVEVDA